ncbi:hypothetical protein LEMLEM_LOCUS25562 [Lemmus lemmus]
MLPAMTKMNRTSETKIKDQTPKKTGDTASQNACSSFLNNTSKTSSKWLLQISPVLSHYTETEQQIIQNPNRRSQTSGICRKYGKCQIGLMSADQHRENEGMQLRNPRTNGQMRHLKQKDESSRKNVPRKRVNWPISISHFQQDKIS